jgi:hypothetical protein
MRMKPVTQWFFTGLDSALIVSICDQSHNEFAVIEPQLKRGSAVGFGARIQRRPPQ